ncbi:hypothetical protein KKF38_00305 [Patescibacteria group bacterium]|nr:hypothetical protein [Patescibacteria group bacterium]
MIEKKEVKASPNFELASLGIKQMCELMADWQRLPDNRTHELFKAGKELSEEEKKRSRENKYKPTYFHLLSLGVETAIKSGIFEDEEEASKWDRERKKILVKTIINAVNLDGSSADIKEDQIDAADFFARKFIERVAEILDEEESFDSADKKELKEIINVHREKIERLVG